jgi:CheY-like chemotaxis protein
MSTRPARPLRVLVVDDNVDSADTLGTLVTIWGHEVRLAHDGPSTLVMARSFQPEVILLDIGLPGMSGYDVARALREQGLGGRRLVALTGWSQDEDRERAREAGFDEHLAKPVNADRLRKVLEGVGGS